MNSECDIVMDLSGIYFDKTAAYETNEFIKNHLKNCENCRKFYKQFSMFKKRKKITNNCEIPKWEGNYDEIARRLKKRRTIVNVLGLAYGLSMLGIIAVLLKRSR